VPFDFFSAGLERYRHTFSFLETPYLPAVYPEVASGSSYGDMSIKSGTSGSGWDFPGSIMDKSTDQSHGRKAQNRMRITLSSYVETGILPIHCSSSKRIKCPIETQRDTCGQSFARVDHLRRHMKHVHSGFSISCKVPRCPKSFSRSGNLYDHYCTHVDVRKAGWNRRLSLYELGQILGSQDISIFRIWKRRTEQPRKPIRRKRCKS
jgi:hypothetical protein